MHAQIYRSRPARINAHNFRKELINEWRACMKFTIGDPTSSSISFIFDRIKTAMSFAEIIRILSNAKIPSDDENQLDDNDSKWMYKIIRKIGAPWNWIYQFVDQCRPNSQSYNFIECQCKRENMEFIPNVQSFNFKSASIPGIGTSVSPIVTDTFLNYVESKAMGNNGMIIPEYFKDEKCPSMC